MRMNKFQIVGIKCLQLFPKFPYTKAVLADIDIVKYYYGTGRKFG